MKECGLDVWINKNGIKTVYYGKLNNISYLKKNCKLFNEICHKQKKIIRAAIAPNDETIVLVFWDSEFRWTVITVSSVYSFYDNSLKFSLLDEIEQNISVIGEKITAEFIELNNKVKIWVPCGAELFALMNILMMFPLKYR